MEYKFNKTIETILNVIGGIAIVFGILAIMAGMSDNNPSTGIGVGGGSILSSLFIFLLTGISINVKKIVAHKERELIEKQEIEQKKSLGD